MTSTPSPPIFPTRLTILLCGLVLSLRGTAALEPTDRFGLWELEQEPKMTPGHFANLFENFAFEYFDYVQPPEIFLRNRAGDCDDYANLGGYILHQAGFKTRLIRVELVGTRVSHAVCYVTEKKAYLDYNLRTYFINLQRSDASIREIAAHVADSFGQNWTTATEYTFSYAEGRSRAVRTVVKTDPPERDPDRPHP